MPSWPRSRLPLLIADALASNTRGTATSLDTAGAMATAAGRSRARSHGTASCGRCWRLGRWAPHSRRTIVMGVACPRARLSGGEDAVLLHLELHLAEHTRLLQLAQLFQLGELGVHVGGRGRGGCGRRWRGGVDRLGLRVLLLLLLLLRRPATLLAPSDAAGHRRRSASHDGRSGDSS